MGEKKTNAANRPSVFLPVLDPQGILIVPLDFAAGKKQKVNREKALGKILRIPAINIAESGHCCNDVSTLK